MPVRHLLIPCLAAVLVLPASVEAQSGKDRFLSGLEAFVNAVAGANGDEGPVLVAAVAQMRGGLEQWDAQITAIEARFAAEVAAAPAAAAARMHAALGSIYLERGRHADAIARLDAAPRLDPAFADVQLLRALAYEAAGRSADAANAHRALVARERGNPPAHAYLFLRTTAGAVPSPLTATALQDLLAAVEGVASKGGPLFPVVHPVDDAAVTAPIFPPAVYADAFGLLRSHRYDAAVASLAAAVAADPLVTDAGLKDPEVRETIAALETPGSPAPLAALDAAAARVQSGQVYRIAGMAYWARKQYPESLERLGHAVRLNPLDERARVAAAEVLVESGQPAAARQALLDTSRAMPTSGLAQWTLGRLAQSMGDEAGALRAFEAAAALPAIAGAAHVHAAVGRLYHNQLDLDAAAAAYRRRVELTPNDSAAHYDLGEIHRAAGHLDAAMAELAVAALLDPANAKVFSTIGQIHAAAGRDDAAVDMLRKATVLDAADLEARYALGRALMRLGRTAEAQQELEIFTQLQAKAMAEERRRFKENQAEIDEVLKAGEPPGAAR